MKDLAIMFGVKLLVIGAVVSVVLLSGCGTVAGIGSDIQKSAKWTEEKMSGNRVELNK
jgi:predicted small secreted protein